MLFTFSFIIIQNRLGPTCYAASLNIDKLECANGNLGNLWDGCMKQNSLRVRCPKDKFPCNELAGNKKEFSCYFDCSNHGGVKECFNEGKLKNLDLVFHTHCIIRTYILVSSL